MNKTAILLAATLMASTAAHAGALGEANHNLSVNMTEQQVKQSLQNFPYTVSLETCGSRTPSPWKCKVLKFTDAVPPSGGPDPQTTHTGTWQDRYTKSELQLLAKRNQDMHPIQGQNTNDIAFLEGLRKARLEPEQKLAVAKLTVLLSQRDDGSWKVESWF
jgi:hypothetical protein